jgi:hypothetical protein
MTTAQPISRGRRIGVSVLIWVTTLLAVVAIFAVWANRQVFNPDNWANTSTSMLQNPKIRSAVSTYLVDQLYANVDVEAELKAKLPPVAQPLAAPIAGALQSAATTAANRALANSTVQKVWKEANRRADGRFVDIVNGRTGNVTVDNGAVTLDLSAIVKEITNQLGLPDVSSKLPPDVGHLTVFKSDDLALVQNGGKALRHLALALTILVPLLYALAIFLAKGRRRRTLMTVGFAIVLAGVVVLAGRGLIQTQATDKLVKNDANLPAAEAVLEIGTSMLKEIAGAFVIVGIPLILAAWFAGPSKWATSGRRGLAPFLRDEPVWTYVVVVAAMLAIFVWQPIPATGKPAGMIVFLLLALLGTELLRRQTAQEFPDAHDPEAEVAAT